MSIEGTQHLKTPPEQLCKEILDKLADPTKGTLGGQSIRELVEAGEKTGNVIALFNAADLFPRFAYGAAGTKRMRVISEGTPKRFGGPQ
jgi:hypothetical protein